MKKNLRHRTLSNAAWLQTIFSFMSLTRTPFSLIPRTQQRALPQYDQYFGHLEQALNSTPNAPNVLEELLRRSPGLLRIPAQAALNSLHSVNLNHGCVDGPRSPMILFNSSEDHFQVVFTPRPPMISLRNQETKGFPAPRGREFCRGQELEQGLRVVGGQEHLRRGRGHEACGKAEDWGTLRTWRTDGEGVDGMERR